jgi:NADPH-dependent curcumin reductase CurA
MLPSQKEIQTWLAEGKLVAPQTITAGFRPSRAFVDMMAGGNLGKAVVDLTRAGGDGAAVEF